MGWSRFRVQGLSGVVSDRDPIFGGACVSVFGFRVSVIWYIWFMWFGFWGVTYMVCMV